MSQPFQTDFGWHIVKLINKEPFGSFEQMKPELEMMVKRDSRSSLINSALLEDISNKYVVKEYDEQKQYFKSIITTDYLNRGWKLPEDFKKDALLASIDDFQIKNNEFSNYLLANQSKYNGKEIDVKELIDFEFKMFLDSQIMTYHENNLENINEDFAFVLQEYRDGLLLFDLMEKQIWNAAAADSVGLQNFYEKNKNQYFSDESFDGTILTASSKEDLENALKLLKSGKTLEEINAKLNTDTKQSVIISQGNFEKGHQLLADGFKFKEGISKIYDLHDSYSVYQVDKIFQPAIKALEDAKGRVINDYQTYLEENWIKELRSRYKVNVNNDVLNFVKTELAPKR